MTLNLLGLPLMKKKHEIPLNNYSHPTTGEAPNLGLVESSGTRGPIVPVHSIDIYRLVPFTLLIVVVLTFLSCATVKTWYVMVCGCL